MSDENDPYSLSHSRGSSSEESGTLSDDSSLDVDPVLKKIPFLRAQLEEVKGGGGQRFQKQTMKKAIVTKTRIEMFYEKMSKQNKEREMRRIALETEMSRKCLAEADREEYRKKLQAKETQHLRLKRVKVSMAMFEKLRTIGKGAYGKVMIVRLKHTNQIFAMKKMRKDEMLRKNAQKHVRIEKEILESSQQVPWVTRLFFSFQDINYLYLVMEFVQGGDLMSWLIKLDIFTEECTRFLMAGIILSSFVMFLFLICSCRDHFGGIISP